MGEDAIDIAAHKSKSLSAFEAEDWNYVVTVCDGAAETCPVFTGAELLLHWPFPDPADASGSKEKQLTAFRDTRDAIKRRVGEFVRELKVD